MFFSFFLIFHLEHLECIFETGRAFQTSSQPRQGSLLFGDLDVISRTEELVFNPKSSTTRGFDHDQGRMIYRTRRCLSRLRSRAKQNPATGCHCYNMNVVSSKARMVPHSASGAEMIDVL